MANRLIQWDCRGLKVNFNELDFTCKSEMKVPTWSSSPHLANTGKFLVNYRMAHGYNMSGILPNQYRRLCQASDIGVITEDYMTENISAKYQ